MLKNNSPHTNHAQELARTYLKYLFEARRHDAVSCISDSVVSGMPLKDVYLSVLQPVMYEVGRLWQINAIDISVEHFITAATQLTMAHIFPYALTGERNGKRMVGGCLGSELHELGLHMVSDLFESEGWDTYFIGAITPGRSLMDVVEQQMPDVLCLSVTMQLGIPQARDFILSIRTSMKDRCPMILVGGLAFNLNPNLANIIGADGMAVDGLQALTLATHLTRNRGRNVDRL